MLTHKWTHGTADLADAHYIRRVVFIDEQRVPEDLELDGTDGDALHLVVYESGVPVATGRLISGHTATELTPEQESYAAALHIGRMAVVKSHRSTGLGAYTMKLLIEKATEKGHKEIYLHAQTHAQGFYEKMGFVPFGDTFDDAGIEHVAMRMELN